MKLEPPGITVKAEGLIRVELVGAKTNRAPGQIKGVAMPVQDRLVRSERESK